MVEEEEVNNVQWFPCESSQCESSEQAWTDRGGPPRGPIKSSECLREGHWDRRGPLRAA